ncbi:hypothetical protein ISF_05016 [Cordyceps fumosorosea ARSEF 2679]|uniref:Uncharacterized protein n=1 Tax=Cordyceps fumosorosea (strain ARSEF 2679) TaxID=1081104 RepID=A0A167VZ65_CORFA|nr:hypothetical protein ISF_05016 [Cordyceps fumosorosea ARSEF 2679]OAA63140.1 hypothetical protein ISF_05016 [Cordyceps fumosorosea ARSEF 2679]
MCCHEAIQQDTCRAVVSVGSVFPSLLYSALLFGALHKASRIHRDVSRKELDIRIMELRASALASLQTELHHRHHDTNGAPVIATTLMLATCELHFDPDASFWRRHFDCASLLMTGSCQGRQTPTDNTELWRLIYRLFSLMDFLISLPAPRSAMSCPITCESRTKELPLVESVGVIDGNLACSRDLLVVFKWIKTLEDIRQVSDHDEILDLGFDSEDIIRLAEAMPKREGLHPSIVLSTALFVAGCEATGEARSDIRSLLQIQYDITGNQGAHRTLQKLDALWELTLDGPGNRLTQTLPVVNLDNFVPY